MHSADASSVDGLKVEDLELKKEDEGDDEDELAPLSEPVCDRSAGLKEDCALTMALEIPRPA